jgi:hypothetical protein
VIEADVDDQKALRDAGAAFWASLQSDDEPPVDCSDSTYEAVRSLNPLIDPDTEIEIGELWSAYEQTAYAASSYAAELQGIKSQILAAMGTAKYATHNNQSVLRRQMSSAGTPYLKEIA